jgi:hypothetical protein
MTATATVKLKSHGFSNVPLSGRYNEVFKDIYPIIIG